MRQFNHDDDDTDYDALKRARSEDRESIKDIRESLKIDENDLFAKLAAAAAHATPEQRRAAAQKAALVNRQGGVTARGRNNDVDTSAYMNIPEVPQHYEAPAARIPAKYAEIVDTLDRFKFAQDEERRAKQVKIVCTALRNALTDLVLEEVAVNTKTAFKGYAEKVVKAPGGLKVYFNFGPDNKLAVTAKGGFYGDETICVHQTGGKIAASVLRIDGDEQHTDLSNSFEIIIQRYQ